MSGSRSNVPAASGRLPEREPEAANSKPQPPPIPNNGTPVWDLVIADLAGDHGGVAADMAARDALGRARYGTPLQTHNGRDALVDAYEEALDLVVYLRQALEESHGAMPVWWHHDLQGAYAQALHAVINLRQLVQQRGAIGRLAAALRPNPQSAPSRFRPAPGTGVGSGNELPVGRSNGT